jgi:hypothetical protein
MEAFHYRSSEWIKYDKWSNFNWVISQNRVLSLQSTAEAVWNPVRHSYNPLSPSTAEAVQSSSKNILKSSIPTTVDYYFWISCCSTDIQTRNYRWWYNHFQMNPVHWQLNYGNICYGLVLDACFYDDFLWFGIRCMLLWWFPVHDSCHDTVFATLNVTLRLWFGLWNTN